MSEMAIFRQNDKSSISSYAFGVMSLLKGALIVIAVLSVLGGIADYINHRKRPKL